MRDQCSAANLCRAMMMCSGLPNFGLTSNAKNLFTQNFLNFDRPIRRGKFCVSRGAHLYAHRFCDTVISLAGVRKNLEAREKNLLLDFLATSISSVLGKFRHAVGSPSY